MVWGPLCKMMYLCLVLYSFANQSIKTWKISDFLILKKNTYEICEDSLASVKAL